MVPLHGLVALPFANRIGGMRRGIQVGVELDVNWGKIGCAFGLMWPTLSCRMSIGKGGVGSSARDLMALICLGN